MVGPKLRSMSSIKREIGTKTHAEERQREDITRQPFTCQGKKETILQTR